MNSTPLRDNRRSGCVCQGWTGWRALVCLAIFLTASMILGVDGTVQAAKATKTPKSSAGGSAYDVLALVNQVRLSNGLPPFQVNPALMVAAQAHSQYQASIGSTTHIGSGGSNIKSRAIAAGFGGGANVSVIENVYGGMGATPQRAVSWWQGDGPHLATMLSVRHTEAGAGIASSDGVVYITLDVGSVVGGSVAPESVAAATSTVEKAPGVPAATIIPPLAISSPAPDGSVIHNVQPGQTLWSIAAAYKIELSTLLQQNGLSKESYIYPGDKIIIKPANAAPTSTAQPTASESAAPFPAPQLSSPTQPAPTSSLITSDPVPSRTPFQEADPQKPSPARPDPLLILSAGLFFIGAGLFVAGKFLKRNE